MFLLDTNSPARTCTNTPRMASLSALIASSTKEGDAETESVVSLNVPISALLLLLLLFFSSLRPLLLITAPPSPPPPFFQSMTEDDNTL